MSFPRPLRRSVSLSPARTLRLVVLGQSAVGKTGRTGIPGIPPCVPPASPLQSPGNPQHPLCISSCIPPDISPCNPPASPSIPLCIPPASPLHPLWYPPCIPSSIPPAPPGLLPRREGSSPPGVQPGPGSRRGLFQKAGVGNEFLRGGCGMAQIDPPRARYV